MLPFLSTYFIEPNIYHILIKTLSVPFLIIMKKGLILFICLIFFSIEIDAQSAVFEFARHGCAEDLKYAFEDNPEAINFKNSSGFTPLTLACYNGNIETATFLAKRVENINVNSNVGTALMAAVYKENIEITKMLLEFKADPNIADLNETTALHYAVRFSNVELIKLLVAYGADINLKDDKGFSSWDYAIQNNNEPILKILKT